MEENKINEDITIEELIEKKENKENKLLIRVSEKNKIDDNKTLLNNNIICPLCKGNINIKIRDYKIELFDCKNKHKIENVSLAEYKNLQNIDFICEICNRSDKCNYFFRCLSCETNICFKCQLYHDKTHNIINYNKLDYICEIHNMDYNNYCINCKKNICQLCINEHKNHKIITLNDSSSDNNIKKSKINELRNTIDTFNRNIQRLIGNLNQVVNNLEIYFNISNNVINNSIIHKNDDEKVFENLNINIIIEELTQINEESNIINKLKNIYNIYNKMNINKIIIENNNSDFKNINNHNNNTNNNYIKKKIKYPNGDIYEGEFKNNKKEGKGIMIWKEGDKYEGDFKNDIKEGKGKMIWK